MAQPVDCTSVIINSRESAAVVNQSLVTDPTIPQPGFEFPCRTQCALNHFHTGQWSRSLCSKSTQEGLASSDKHGCVMAMII